MAKQEKVRTAIGQPLEFDRRLVESEQFKVGRPPIVFQAQTFAYIPLEKPEELRQFEEDLQTFYGIKLDASALAGRACETCSCCTDDSGMLAL